MGEHHRIAGVVEGTHDSRHHAAIEGADHLRVTRSGLPEGAVGGEENLGVGVGVQLESDSAHDLDQGGQNLFVPGIVGGTDRGGEFLAVLPHGALDPQDLVAWVLEDGLRVRVNLQLHKYIWGADATGV